MLEKLAEALPGIDADALLAAIGEFDRIGRKRFLERYHFDRSSKFYLIHNERLYDTKALVGAAHLHAHRRRLANHRFSGGTQTIAVIQRVVEGDPRFDHSRIIEDSLGELTNIRGDFDTLPEDLRDLNELGFSDWVQLERCSELNTGSLPGVYVIADCAHPADQTSVDDPSVVYIGQTVHQGLRDRLGQFNASLNGKDGHSGGARLMALGYARRQLWLAIRSFSLRSGDEATARLHRSRAIQLLEQHLLHANVRRNAKQPVGNLK